MKTKLRAVRFSESEEYAIGRCAPEFGLAFSDVVRKAAEALLARSAEGRLSLSALAERSSDEDPNLLYGQFLDDFSRADDKGALIEKEPKWRGQNAVFWQCLLAATAHKLAHDNSLPVPGWALSERYVAPEPIYGMDAEDPGFRAYLEKTTPMEFRCHRLFLGGNALSRA